MVGWMDGCTTDWQKDTMNIESVIIRLTDRILKERQADQHTYRQTDKLTDRQMEVRQTDIQTYIYLDVQTYRHADIQTHRHTA